MNGVEAAASLFGSEESGSDLFATLGAESTSPQPPADDLFPTNTSSLVPEAEVFDFSSHFESHSAQPSTVLEYPTHSTDAEGYVTSESAVYGSSADGYAEKWGEHEQSNLTLGYDAPNSTQQADPPSYNTYTPATYSAPATMYPSYSAYDPPAPASTYIPYASESLGKAPSSQTYTPQAGPSATSRPQYNSVSSVPALYDPPAPGSTYAPYTPYTAESHASTTSQVQYTSVASVPAPYDPPASASSYTPYTPSATGKAPSNQSYTPQGAPPTTSQPQYNSVASGQTASPPVKSTITRPKVSNAYDPPFMSTLPSRRTSRAAGGASQIYNSYQSHASPYATSLESSSTFTGLQYQQPVALQGENIRPPVEAPSDIYSRETNQAQPSVSGLPYPDNGYPRVPTTHANHNIGHSAEPEQSYTPQDSFEHVFSRNGSMRDSGEETFASNVSNTELHATERAYSPPSLRPSSVDSTCLTQQDSSENGSGESTFSNAVSPRSVPLPFSPPVQKEVLEDPEGLSLSGSESIGKQPPQQSPYIPYQAPRRDLEINKDIHDPYAPRSNHGGTNYIPRTSSPLSLYNGRPSDSKKTVAASFMNGVTSSPYSSASRPSLGTHPPVPPLKVSSLYSVDDQAPRQTPHWSETKLGPQDIFVKPTSVQYAPSPSLIGANDPLSRTSARAPVVTFGFGGKMISCFHGMPGLNAGFDVALSSRTSSELKVHTLQKLLPESVLNYPGPSYPGPLLSDPGTSTISLVRSGQTTQTKTKKAGVLAYLSGRASEIHQGLGYLANVEKQTAENKLVLIKLLSIMVENDGRLLGTPQSDSAVRSTLIPRLEGLTTTLHDGVSLQVAFNSGPLDEAPISVTTLRPSTLDKIEELLLQGDRRQAYQFAMDQKLWAHAMIIASSIDKESWKEVVNDFLRTELGVKEDAARGPSLNGSQTQKSDRESLRVAYSLFSGQGAAAVQELAPINLLQRGTSRLQAPMLPALPAITPRTPNFPPMPPTISIPSESLCKWAETAAMIISSPLTPETAGALTALGDQLLSNNWVEAAHSCYLLSSQTSLLGGLGHPSARITLVGAKTPAEVMRDSDPLIFSEILEFALSLVPAVKGQEPFHGLPHLQAYRFIRAVSLAEIGDIQLANRYCEAIAASLSNTSAYTTVALLEQLQGLQQRISGVFHGDKSGSWIGGKISKPSLDTIGGWLEGRFTKLVTGDSDSPTPTAENTRSNDQPFAGPFAHYSTISSTTPSARSSPQPTPATLTALPPPQRTTSAMATSTPYSQVQIERSSSAMGYMRQKPAVQTTKATTGSMSSSQSSPTGYGLNGHSRYDSDAYAPKSEEPATPVQTASSWWGSDENNTSNNTPTAATFMQIDESSIKASSDGFISLMDNHSFSTGPGSQPGSHGQQSNSTSQQTIEEEDDDDLGLGNSKPKPKPETQETEPTKEEKSAPATPSASQNAEAPAPAGGWLSRWWKKSDSTTPGPIKASLGDDNAFYYDKDLKKWINKKAAAEEKAKAAAAPLPPPPRAQTASPGMTGSKPEPHSGAPPPRSSSVSAIDLSTEPPTRAPMRIRSNLAPPTESAPSTPTGTRMLNPAGLPPPGRPKSGAAKRNIRSRYVDVFQQEGGGAVA